MVCCQHGLQIAEDDYVRASFPFSQAPFKNISQSDWSIGNLLLNIP